MVLKVVINAGIYDEKMKQKAFKVVTKLEGIESIDANIGTGKLTVIGELDAIAIVEKLNSYNSWPCKNWPHAVLDSVGPKEEKKEEKKDEKKEEKEKIKNYYEAISRDYQNWQPNIRTQNYYAQSIEEDPTACVIS